MYLMAEMIWAKMSLLSRSVRRPLLVMRENRSPPLPYSIARYKCLLVSSTSYRRTMFGWESFSMQMISEANRFCDFLSRRALLRIFTATRSVRQREGNHSELYLGKSKLFKRTVAGDQVKYSSGFLS